jgi:response regulator RpfG family c-di-GMP phosphodiesterase
LQKCKAVGMDYYVTKPVDEKLLSSKIVELVVRPINEYKNKKSIITQNMKAIDLSNLRRITESDAESMLEISSLYLEQTPRIIKAMKEILMNKDWKSLEKAVHKIVPSFSIVGIHPDYERMARKVNKLAGSQKKRK